MGFDLKPRNRKVDWFHCNIYGYLFLMATVGSGRAIGLEHFENGGYTYIPDRNGYDPVCNDGYYVTAGQARDMADIVDKWLCNQDSADFDQHRIAHAVLFRDWLRECSGYWVY